MTRAADFWSRRRARVEAEQRAETTAQEQAALQAEEARLSERSDEDLLQELGLPDPDALETPDQVQQMLRAKLPQRLKTRALRRLWRMNPVLANLDGLVDYDDDFTDAATVVENLQTVYQVGKGMLTAFDTVVAEIPDIGAHADDATADNSDPDALAQAPLPPAGAATDAPVLAPATQSTPVQTAAAPADAGEAMPHPARRRMRFAFDT